MPEPPAYNPSEPEAARLDRTRKAKTATLYDSKLESFKRSEHEHQIGDSPADVLESISRLEIQGVPDYVPIQRHFTVLDVGAGGGRWTLALADKVAAITAVEPSALFDVLVSRTKALRNVACMRQPFEDLVLKDQYDLVIIYGTLMYVTTDEQANEFLSKAARAVRKGGYLVVGEAVARRYKCVADWKEISAEAFLANVLPTARYWEVIRPPAFYRNICRSNGLDTVAEFESHAPLFGKTRAWGVIRSLPWSAIRAYNKLFRSPYGALKWGLDMRRMRMMVWTRRGS